MNDERQEELASLYALGALPAKEARAVESEMAHDPVLRAMVRDFQNAAAALTHAAPPVAPPANLEAQLIAQIHAENAVAISSAHDGRWLVWAGIAAALAILATLLGLERQQLGREVTVLRVHEKEAVDLAAERARLESEIAVLRENETKTAAQDAILTTERVALLAETARLSTERTRMERELAALQKKETLDEIDIRNLTAQLEEKDALATLDIRTLAAQLDETRKTLAAVVWSQEQQSGILTLEKLKPPGPGEDYQLWVIDGASPAPVSAGLLHVDEKGGGRYEFKSTTPVGSAGKFAISREKKGGSTKPEGPIVLLSL